MRRIQIITIFLLSILFLFSCHKKKFNSEYWTEYGAADGPSGSERLDMAEDLVKSRRLIGLNTKQMLKLLGPPLNDSTSTWYRLQENYDIIDPVSGSYLQINFNKDSIIKKASIIKWHKH